MKNRPRKSFVAMLALVLGMACTQFAPAQTFKRVRVYGGVPLVQVSAGGASVWARASNGNPYILKGKQFVLANSIFLTQIAVGGGNLRQADAVWGLDSSGNIYRASKSGTTWVFNQMPGVLSQIAVGPSYSGYGPSGWSSCYPYEVWGLNPSSEIYRFNYCSNNWEWIPGILTKLALGGGQVWGMNGNGQVYRFLGYTPDPSWMQIPTISPLADISAGPSGLWGIRLQDNALLQLDENLRRINAYYPPWQQWYTPVVGVWVGGDGVWTTYSSDLMFIPQADPSAPVFRGFPSPVAISAGGAGVWGINSSGQVYAFSAP